MRKMAKYRAMVVCMGVFRAAKAAAHPCSVPTAATAPGVAATAAAMSPWETATLLAAAVALYVWRWLPHTVAAWWRLSWWLRLRLRAAQLISAQLCAVQLCGVLFVLRSGVLSL